MGAETDLKFSGFAGPGEDSANLRDRDDSVLLSGQQGRPLLAAQTGRGTRAAPGSRMLARRDGLRIGTG
jgi:hypothetical protein